MISSVVPRLVVCASLAALVCGAANAGALLDPQPAPDWQISEWINDNPGSLRAQRGKVVLIEFFQLWCPGCKEFSSPLFERWHETYGERDDVLVVSIHTVFEGHDQQRPERLRAFVRERGVDHPVGIDAYTTPGDEVPITMDRFETEGTPHVAIIDKEGLLVFSHFGTFAVAPVEAYIERLLKAKRDSPTTPKIMRAGEGPRRSAASPPPASNAPRRPTPRRTPPPNPNANRKPESPESDEPSEATVGGTYRITFEQVDKSCGSPIPPLTLLADLIVQGDQLEIRVRRPFLGLHKFPATLDVDTGDFRASSTGQARERGEMIDLALELSGSVMADASPPTIDYEFMLEKTGPTPGWECVIEGRGNGERTSGPRR